MVAQGETIEFISRRYGVPAAAILQANNMRRTADLSPASGW